MNEIKCLIKTTTYINDKEFYIVQEQSSKEEHYIPSNQIKILD